MRDRVGICPVPGSGFYYTFAEGEKQSDAGGRVNRVPYLGAGHLPNGVRSYPVHEIDGMIFVFPGNPEFADARRPVSAC